jgi:hypothetical protein
MACFVFCAMLSIFIANAQDIHLERTFHGSKDAVEEVLRDLHAEGGGKLPTLEGFAKPGGDALDKYQRGYYSYCARECQDHRLVQG